MSNIVMEILTWPVLAYDDIVNYQIYVPPAAALAAAYWMAGGLPNQGQDMMELGQAYLAGGVAFVGANYVVGMQPVSTQPGKPGKKPPM